MWKKNIEDLLNESGGDHTAWGAEHCMRVYDLSLELAGDEEVDKEALYAAALLHDFGAYEKYATEGVDHVDGSTRVAGEILERTKFPEKKRTLVEKIIAGHMFYNTPEEDILEAKLFHDADVLDFLGYIGITRLLSVIGRSQLTPDMKGTIATLKRFKTDLPNSLSFSRSKIMADTRVKEMELFFKGLDAATKEMKYV